MNASYNVFIFYDSIVINLIFVAVQSVKRHSIYMFFIVHFKVFRLVFYTVSL